MTKERSELEVLQNQANDMRKKAEEQTKLIQSQPPKKGVEKSVDTLIKGVQDKINTIRISNIKGSEEFVNCLIVWQNDPKHELDLNQMKSVLDFVDKSCDLLLFLSKKPGFNEIKDASNSLNELKQKLPPTTFGRCILGFINALLVPFFAMLETVKLLGGDTDYRYTKSTARDSYYLFKSPVSPAIELIEEMYETIEANKGDMQVNPDYKLV